MASPWTAAVPVLALALTGTPRAVPHEIELESIWGDVRFPHARHFATQKCANCHVPGQQAGRIDAVHEKMEPAHAFCVGCHRREAGLTGEPDCGTCHQPRPTSDDAFRTTTAQNDE